MSRATVSPAVELPRMIGTRECREMLGVSSATFARMRAMGKLPKPVALSRACLRWDTQAVLRWLEEMQNGVA